MTAACSPLPQLTGRPAPERSASTTTAPYILPARLQHTDLDGCATCGSHLPRQAVKVGLAADIEFVRVVLVVSCLPWHPGSQRRLHPHELITQTRAHTYISSRCCRAQQPMGRTPSTGTVTVTRRPQEQQHVAPPHRVVLSRAQRGQIKQVGASTGIHVGPAALVLGIAHRRSARSEPAKRPQLNVLLN